MTTSIAATGLTLRARARSIMLVASFMTIAPLAGCSRARPVTDASIEQSVRYPRDAARFTAEPRTDSTLSFAADEARWVVPGMLGIAVDPTRGDALVAKLQITSVTNGRVEALVTGQTTRVASGHVVLLVRPRTPWWRQRVYWLGTLSGALFGAGLALLF